MSCGQQVVLEKKLAKCYYADKCFQKIKSVGNEKQNHCTNPSMPLKILNCMSINININTAPSY